ncbi:MAG: hypothetical protein GY816_09930 [Cytophagales bacterium]|nr:hypothetical protein [Cytophagales bacterium]
MEFNLLFGLVSALSFHIQFIVTHDERQDYFYFSGENETAHLFRENNTVTLYLAKDLNFSIYEADFLGTLSFTWEDFKINGIAMTLVRANGNVESSKYNTFTFLSPMIHEPLLVCSTQPVMTFKSINYGYLIAIVSIVAAVFDLKPVVVKRIRDILLKQHIYETAQRMSTETEV